jgi:hypothetical protein
LFTINSSLTPHWIRRDNSLDLAACSDSFRLCFCLYRRAAYFVSHALLLWWLLARDHASTQLELTQIGDLSCRLSVVPQDVPARVKAGYKAMVNFTRRSGGFWHRVWIVASSLLLRHRIPSPPGLLDGARIKVSTGGNAPLHETQSPPAEQDYYVRGFQACCPGGFQCSSCASAPGGALFAATSIIARAFRRFLHRRAVGLVDGSVSCASSVPHTVPPAAELSTFFISTGLDVCPVYSLRPLPAFLVPPVECQGAGALASDSCSNSPMHVDYTIASQVLFHRSPWSGDGLRPRASSLAVSFLVHGSVEGVGRMHCALGCAVDETLPRPVLEHWGSHVALAILLLSAPVVPFTVHWDFDGECYCSHQSTHQSYCSLTVNIRTLEPTALVSVQ